MLEKNGRCILAAALALLVALLLLFRMGSPASAPALSANTRNRVVEHRPEIDGVVEPEEGERVRKVRDRPDVPLAPHRSKRENLAEVTRVFGQAEAGRARKLAERFSSESGDYFYLVEHPSDGEIQAVKARIADRRNEVAREDREDFETQLEKEIASYDPYGEKERKALWITVPVKRAGRISGMIMEVEDPDGFREKFLSDGPVHIKARQGFVAS
ncbi:MAG: hypothetical protein EOP87_20555, partial [Verrucomicrobiaceae bacterium]